MKREQLVAISIITTRFVELEGDVGEVSTALSIMADSESK